MNDTWREKYRRFIKDRIHYIVTDPNDPRIGIYAQDDIESFISTTREEAKDEERERIWKKGRESVNERFLEILLRNAREPDIKLAKVFAHAVVEGLIDIVTMPSKENTK